MGLAATDAEPARGILTVVVKFCVINTSGKCFDMKKKIEDPFHFALINHKNNPADLFFFFLVLKCVF